MNINKYLYEIIDDYKNANSEEEKSEIFKDFCSSIWSSKNKRRVYTKTIKFKVRSDLLESEIGQIFDAYSEIDYTGYKAMTNETDWCSLLRQKINNLYTRYFDEEVILKRDYMNLLRTSKRLYYRWVDGEEFDADGLTDIIDSSIHEAEALKDVYRTQKIELSWNDYKAIIEVFLKRAFDNCKLIEDYESNAKLLNIYDLLNEDNFYIKYISNSLDGEMLKWQKDRFGLKRGKKRGKKREYMHCKKCGDLIEKTNNRVMYCKSCAAIVNREKTKNNMIKIRNRNV